MPDRIVKAVIFDGRARVTAVDLTETVAKSIKIHKLSPLAAACLGRAMTAGAYIATNLKGKDSKFSAVVEGGGPAGRIIVAGGAGNVIKGCIANHAVDLPAREDGKLNVGAAVGKDGEITVIKDFNLKEPYVGRIPLVSGEIAEDFSHYLLKSEGIPNMTVLGVLVNKSGCVAAGGIVVEAMPDITDDELFILEDIENHIKNISALIAEKPIEELVSFHFGHLKANIFPAEKVNFRPNCPPEKLRALIRTLGEREAKSIVAEQGKIEIFYEFNSKYYVFDREDVEEIFGK